MAEFAQQLLELRHKKVKLWRGGPDAVEGYLLDSRDDYLTLYREDGRVVHYPLHHLKSVTQSVEQNLVDASATPYLPTHLVESNPSTFYELMQVHVGKKVNINDHGPESFSGFLFECGKDYIKVVTTPDEMVGCPMFHIRSMSTMMSRDRNTTDLVAGAEESQDERKENKEKEKNKKRSKR